MQTRTMYSIAYIQAFQTAEISNYVFTGNDISYMDSAVVIRKQPSLAMKYEKSLTFINIILDAELPKDTNLWKSRSKNTHNIRNIRTRFFMWKFK